MQTQSTLKLKKILIVYNSEKLHALQKAQAARNFLKQVGIETTLTTHRLYDPMESPPIGHIQACAQDCDLVLVLGGDGTLLGVAREIAQSPKPLVGINLGGFGFLTTSSDQELIKTLELILSGRYHLVHRYFLEAWVERSIPTGVETVFQSLALNESLVTLSRPGRLLDLWLGEEHEPALSYRADGLIIATPTGSTGHSLSAGGPILEPHLAALIVTPVSPHSLFNRPLVYDGERELSIWFREGTAELVLILDGQIQTTLLSTDRVHIRRSQHTIPTVALLDHPFSRVLRYKFNLGNETL